MTSYNLVLFSGSKRPLAAAITAVLIAAAPITLASPSTSTNPETYAEANPDAAKKLDELVVVGTIGRNEEIDLGTLRGKVIDLPQTLNVISQQTLEQRQVSTLGDALRNVAGVTTQVGEGGVVSGDQFLIRGQSARNDVFTDGLRDFGVFTRDSFNYEAVQVLKGSSSTA